MDGTPVAGFTRKPLGVPAIVSRSNVNYAAPSRAPWAVSIHLN